LRRSTSKQNLQQQSSISNKHADTAKKTRHDEGDAKATPFGTNEQARHDVAALVRDVNDIKLQMAQVIGRSNGCAMFLHRTCKVCVQCVSLCERPR